MRNILSSNGWLIRMVRITLFAAVGWWAVKDIVRAQVPGSIEWPNTNFEKSLVDLDEIMSGGPPKDGIPSIPQNSSHQSRLRIGSTRANR